MKIRNDQDLNNHGLVEMEGIKILYSETGSDNLDIVLLNVISSSY